ncbi:hypothetical protein GCM10027074_70440 [Streptomyces deserti]
MALGRLQMLLGDTDVVPAGQGPPLQAATALQQVQHGPLLLLQAVAWGALALEGVAAAAQRAAYKAMVMAVTGGTGSRRRGWYARGQVVEHAAQVAGVPLEGVP